MGQQKYISTSEIRDALTNTQSGKESVLLTAGNLTPTLRFVISSMTEEISNVDFATLVEDKGKSQEDGIPHFAAYLSNPNAKPLFFFVGENLNVAIPANPSTYGVGKALIIGGFGDIDKDKRIYPRINLSVYSTH
jgi:hypothetical protein